MEYSVKMNDRFQCPHALIWSTGGVTYVILPPAGKENGMSTSKSFFSMNFWVDPHAEMEVNQYVKQFWVMALQAIQESGIRIFIIRDFCI